MSDLPVTPSGALSSVSEPTINTIEDGFGNQWMKCEHAECDLCVVRPGKVQCSGFCEGFSNDAAVVKPE